MNELSDLLLDQPLSDAWFRGLLFFTFAVHFVFVLLTVGTAILGVVYYARGQFDENSEFKGWDKEFLKPFFVYKSLAITFGVAPILLMQAGNSVAFITAANLLAPLWLAIIVLLIAALLLLEWVGERCQERRWRYLWIGLLGLACMVAVPGIFAAVLTVTENPDRWTSIFALGGRLPLALSIHWVLRYLHVLGAAALITAAFQHAYIVRQDAGRSSSLRGWMVGSLAFQFVVGIGLYASLAEGPGLVVNSVVVLGVLAAAWLLWTVYQAQLQGQGLKSSGLALTSLTLLTSMLLARQMLQDRALYRFNHRLAENSREYQAQIAHANLTRTEAEAGGLEAAYDNAPTVYLRSCEFCHGTVGNGEGDAATELLVPPEDLTALRIGPDAFRKVLLTGVPGTGMPRFDMYSRPQQAELMEFLERHMGMRQAPEPVEREISAAARSAAAKKFATTCAVCHGADGHVTELASHFRPPPPDLTAITFSADYAFEVVTSGYPNTMMPSFAELPEETRWALVILVQELHASIQRHYPRPSVP